MEEFLGCGDLFGFLDFEEVLEERGEVEEPVDAAGFEGEDDFVRVFFFQQAKFCEGFRAYLVDASDVGVVLGKTDREAFFFFSDGKEYFVEDFDGSFGGLYALFQGDDWIEFDVDDCEEFTAESVWEGEDEWSVVSLCGESSFDGGERREFHLEDLG